jgi:hypothetical protein
MKIKDILGEAGGSVATIKDYKPGQSLSFTDQEGSTMTTIDLKKNPMAVKPDEQGNLTYDPTPDTQAAVPGQTQAPEIKPGAQIQIDTATTEEQTPDEAGRIFRGASVDVYKRPNGKFEVVLDQGISSQVLDTFDTADEAIATAKEMDAEEMKVGMNMEPSIRVNESRNNEEVNYITEMARRITKVPTKDVKAKADKAVFDIKRLAGL